MDARVTRHDCVGLVHPAIDAHTLGISAVAQILEDCGCRTVIADAVTCAAFNAPDEPANAAAIIRWIANHRITVLGFSYRLDPTDGADQCGRLLHLLRRKRLIACPSCPVKAVYFAGLPDACALVQRRHPEIAGVFVGDETAAETLEKLGLGAHALPRETVAGMAYDEARLAFGRELVSKDGFGAVPPSAPRAYPEYGTASDTLVARLRHAARHNTGPLMRAHVGPYLPDRGEAVALFFDWCRRLAAAGFLDILSIGTSQLTQSHFGCDWTGLPNGGGVPLNDPAEFAAAWQAARPMLVRSYAGTRDPLALARMYEQTINTAWHALSLWWFCQLDGRGPYGLRENLDRHLDTIAYIATRGKPFEANVPHHFAFRGADDVSFVVAAVIAARVAKRLGIRTFVLQVMLNTPKTLWGIQDLAKARAMLVLVRELAGDSFEVVLQPRGGLDYFSHDEAKAKAQLAAVTALMDDIEPQDRRSPAVIHVVSYSEAARLADPPVVDESIRITRHAMAAYRALRQRGAVDDMGRHPDVVARTAELVAEARTVLGFIDQAVPGPWSADRLYRIFAAGFLPVPQLWSCRDEFPRAVAWTTRLVKGSVKVVDDQGIPMPAGERMERIRAQAVKR